MQNNAEPDFQSQLDAVFAHLNPQAVEEFYSAYQQWALQRRASELRQRIEAVRTQQAENEQRLQETRPSAIALATLARLQSNGVSDFALLDAMLERGESWLDQTMQRLDYFEQFDDFINDDYTRWCQGALEGAFDWIDSLLENTEQAAPVQPETPPTQESASSEDAGEVEALLLQRLATEREDDLSWQEAITIKRPALQLAPSETVPVEAAEQEPAAPEEREQQETGTQAQTAEFIPLDEPAQSEEAPTGSATPPPAAAEEQIVPEEASPVEESAITATEADQPTFVEFAPVEELTPDEDELSAGEQPALVESAPTEQPPLAETETETGSEQPALMEFAAPSEVSQAEESPDQTVEQAEPGEAVAPEEVEVEVPTAEDAAQSGVNEPGEVENSATGEASPDPSQQISANTGVIPAQSTRRKGGLLRLLLRFLAGV